MAHKMCHRFERATVIYFNLVHIWCKRAKPLALLCVIFYSSFFFLIYMFFFISSNFFVQLMVLPHAHCWNLKKLIQTASYILFKEIELLSVFTIFTCNVLWIVCHRNLHQRVSNANLAFWKKKRKIKSNHLVRFI